MQKPQLKPSERTHRSAKAFGFGERADSFSGFTPLAFSASNDEQNFASRSRNK